ncbi:MAG: SDR family oxidoreductase [Proteobacteria bacterium]|nr:SDR family oxidoreductase [Pseudomonadota bacterium]MCP4918295.1 SDR family oxidoreductase [Pseudomonadota bacterium]
MLVLIGANGRTGREVLRLALSQGRDVRPVVRDDRDIDQLHGIADVQALRYADPDHMDPLRVAFEGATAVLSCIDPRTVGPGARIHDGQAAENIVNAARDVGAEKILHVSMMGAYRWSYAMLNRRAFYLEGGVRNCEAPWAILRLSCYFDEVVEGHVRPPDGARPHPFKPSSRYSPTSRRDAARLILAYLDRFELGRARAVGGPEVFTGEQLTAAVAPFVRGRGWRKTRYASLPPGDVSVAPETTCACLGFVPEDRLASALADDDPEDDPGGPRVDTVYPRGDPAPHASDQGKGLEGAGPDLRRVVHRQLMADLDRVGVVGASSLDFSGATTGARWVTAHDGQVAEQVGVRVLDASGDELYLGAMDVLRDKLADEFRCWWAGSGIPSSTWRELDMGVRRRLSQDRHFKDDALVRVFLEQNPWKDS